MDSMLLWSILDQCRNIGIKRIVFSGGEPMLHPDFLNAVSRAAWDGVNIKILSNLTELTDTIITKLKESKVSIEIQTSLYSVDPIIHDKVTAVPGSCELTKQGIEKLTERNIPVVISCPITTRNKKSYPGVLAFAKQFGLWSLPNNMITGQSDGSGNNLLYRLNVNDAVKVIQDILDNDTAYNAEQFLPDYHNLDDALPCVQDICRNTIFVNAEGKVVPQPGWNRVLGDTTRQTLLDIWENSPDIIYLRRISLKDFPKCVACPDIHFCTMNLEGNANENPQGDPLIIPDFICAYARAARILVHSHHMAKEAL
jgi:MoaA/NifB/PqqE/SkfB family radical SAM enzyme